MTQHNMTLQEKLQEIISSQTLTEPEKFHLSKQIQKELCKKDLFYLITKVLGYNDLTSYHRKICNGIMLYKNSWQLHLHPRGHFKSTIITIGETIQDILINPNVTHLIANAVLGKAQAFLYEIKSHFEKNYLLKELFPEHAIQSREDKGNTEEWTTPGRTNFRIREPTISVTGIEKAQVSAHFDKITFDDIVNDLNVTTKEQRNKIRRKYAEYLSLLNPPGMVRMVGTRWHYYDIYGWLLERLGAYTYEGERERSESGTEAGTEQLSYKDFHYKIFITKIFDEQDNNNIVFPERFTKDIIERLQEQQGSYIFSCQYLNNPQPDDEKDFDISKVKIVERVSIPPNTLSFQFSATDPTVGLSSDSDPATIVTISVNSLGEIFITRIVRGWFNPDEFIDMCLSVARSDHPLKFGIEVTAFQKTLRFFLEKERLRRNIHINIEEIKRSTRIHKEDRIRRIQPYLQNGLIYVVDNPSNPSENTRQLLEELNDFPYGKYDDILDALADCIELHKVPGKAPKNKIVYERTGDDSPYHTGARFRIRTVAH